MLLETVIKLKDTEEIAERLFKVGDISDGQDEDIFFYLGSLDEIYGEFEEFEIITWNEL